MDNGPKLRNANFGLTCRASDAGREVAGVIQGLKTRSAVYAGPDSAMERDPSALATALDALRIQHEELLIADEELRAQLEELSRVEEVIANERARSQAVFAFAPDAYVITDFYGSVLECNLAALTLFGRDDYALVEKPIAAMVARDDVSALYAASATARRGEKTEVLIHVRQRGRTSALPTMAVVTRMGAESLFWRFRLLADAEARFEPVAPLRPAAVRPLDDALRILVLSQDEAVLATFEAASKSYRGVVETAPNIGAAVDVLGSFQADIVVADLWSDGHLKHDILAQLRLIGHRPMPVGIALSGVTSADSTYALKAGFNAFLMKPISIESARSALNTVSRVLLKRSTRRTRAVGG